MSPSFGLPNGLLPMFLFLYPFFLFFMHATCPTHPNLPLFDHRNNIWQAVQITELLTGHSPTFRHPLPRGFRYSSSTQLCNTLCLKWP